MKEYRLNIDPRILELLGPNLYTNIYYVLAELIANAYDADASNVYIIAKSDSIRVEDDGHGMSYEGGDIEKFLNVAGVSRTSANDSATRSGRRQKMGRKGVGKLAALSVSEEVDVLTVANGERSGFVMSRQPQDENRLKPIPDDAVEFERIRDHGSAMVMRNPRYSLHKSAESVRRNLLKMFPLVNADFRIHVSGIGDDFTIDRFDENVMTELCALITLGDRFESLAENVPDIFPARRQQLVEKRGPAVLTIRMKNNVQQEGVYELQILGWIGAYKSTRGRKAEVTDFPDNFISLFANEKLGEFNILPSIGQNKLNEVYVVGQLHVDLFELTELPDMALSNRQGYKTDDPRYEAVRDYARETLLAEILSKRELFADLSKAKRKGEQEDAQRHDEEKLKEAMNTFRRNASQQAAESIAARIAGTSREDVRQIVAQSISDNSFDLGLKRIVDEQKKRILISQTYRDKAFADIAFEMLLFNNVPPSDILYTSCDDEVCRVPEGRRVYDYLRDFFVESYSTQKILVLFVTSENTKSSWGAISEIGAAWITRIDSKIFNVYPFRPEHPLDDQTQWQSTNRESPTDGELWMNALNADVMCQKIEHVCDVLGYRKQSRTSNRARLATLVAIHD